MDLKFREELFLRCPSRPIRTRFTEEGIKDLFQEKEMREALYLASPNLLGRFDEWLGNGLSSESEEEELMLTLRKYASRIHTRCTPFGLFAGCGMARFGERSDLEIRASDHFRRTVPDMDVACALAQKLSEHPKLCERIDFYPNTSIYEMHDRIRYVEHRIVKGLRDHRISSVERSEYLEKVLERAKEGGSLDELSEALTGPEVQKEEARSFVWELVQAGLLFSELEPSVTGAEPFEQLRQVLDRIRDRNDDDLTNGIHEYFEGVLQDLEEMDRRFTNDPKDYDRLSERFKELGYSSGEKKPFKIDRFVQPVRDALNKKHQPLLRKAIKVLSQLNKGGDPPHLRRFKEAFQKRYGDRIMPLPQVMDNDAGIGYGSGREGEGGDHPLLDGLRLPGSVTETRELHWHPVDAFLHKKLFEAHKENRHTVHIDPKEIKGSEEIPGEMPNSMGAGFSVILDEEGMEKIFLRGVKGPSAINILGRYGSGHEGLKGLARSIASREIDQEGKKVHASILHLPQSGAGNILHRPALRDHEIPYLSNSHMSGEKQIPVDDLYVTVRHDRVRLYSKSLKKEVLPCLDNAHAYSLNSLPLYHFLCDLQQEGKKGHMGFDWGALKGSFPFLPRVEVQGVIVFPATWQLSKDRFKTLLEDHEDLEKRVKEFQQKWKMPDQLLLVDGDNELLINLKESLDIRMFRSELKRRKQIVLREFLFGSGRSPVQDEGGNSYANEFMAVLEPETSQKKTGPSPSRIGEEKNPAPRDRAVRRTFLPGSEWVFFKLYCGKKTADRILTDILRPLTEKFREEGKIDQWFFLRLSDPDFHLRVRFHCDQREWTGPVVQEFHDALQGFQDHGLIWKVQMDSYQRELERYGSNSIDIAEQLFYYDSIATVKALRLIRGEGDEELRWLYGLRSVHKLLNDFRCSLADKQALMERKRNSFMKEFKADKKLKKQLDKKFRAHEEAVHTCLNEDSLPEDSLVDHILQERSRNLHGLANKLYELKGEGHLQLSLDDLLSSYIHMLINRLFNNKPRVHELVLYEFMWKAYRSKVQKEKHSPGTKVQNEHSS